MSKYSCPYCNKDLQELAIDHLFYCEKNSENIKASCKEVSDINGTGYGSNHNWKRGYTPPSKITYYDCRNCGEGFGHPYDDIPDVFQAMALMGVREHCRSELKKIEDEHT